MHQHFHFTPEKKLLFVYKWHDQRYMFWLFCHLLLIFGIFQKILAKYGKKNYVKNKFHKQKQIVAKLPADQKKNRDLLPKSLRTETYMLDCSEV